jgi:5-carboxymethyl-2-hydroxymuconic-semialdehyde dehydrogenase
MAQGAPTLKRVHFELGGKNPSSSSKMPTSIGPRSGGLHDLQPQRERALPRAVSSLPLSPGFFLPLSSGAFEIFEWTSLDPETDVGPLVSASTCRK